MGVCCKFVRFIRWRYSCFHIWMHESQTGWSDLAWGKMVVAVLFVTMKLKSSLIGEVALTVMGNYVSNILF